MAANIIKSGKILKSPILLKNSAIQGFHGGEREIRTLGRVLAFTRFPVVRLRPAQPSLHIILNWNYNILFDF